MEPLKMKQEPVMKRLFALCITILSLLPGICLAATSPGYIISGDALLNGGGSAASSGYAIHGSAVGSGFYKPGVSMGSPSYIADGLFIGNPQQTGLQHTLTVSFGGSGSGTVGDDVGLLCAGSKSGDSCSITLLYSKVVNLTASPLSASTFSGWSGACSGSGACQVTMGSDRAVTANFAINSFTITASAGPNGSITPTETVNQGETRLYSVTPDIGHHITDVTIDEVSQSIPDPKTFSHTFTNVTADHTISASFAADTFTVDLHRCISGPTTVDYNATPTYAFTSGFDVAATINGSPVTVTGNSYTYQTGITANQTINGLFTINPVGVNDPVQLMRGETVVATKTNLQDAYDIAESGDVILMKAFSFAGGLRAERKIDVTVKGGYEATFTSSCTMTRTGKIEVRAGSVAVQYMLAR
jgi:hypothetical protein